MPSRRIAGAVLAAALAPPLAAQPATTTKAEDVLQAARALLAKGDADGALVLAWAELEDLDPFSTDRELRKRRAALEALAAKADPSHAARRKALGELAKALVDLAKTETAAGWLDAARADLEAAGRLSPARARGPMRALRRKLARRRARAELAAALEGDLLADFEVAHRRGKWTLREGIATSPELTGFSVQILARNHEHRNARVAVDADAGAAGSAALLFGVRSETSYYILEMRKEPGRPLVLSLHHYTPRRARNREPARSLGHVEVDLPPGARRGPHTIEARIRGDEVECLLDGRGKKLLTPTEAHGGLGLLVPANSPSTHPVRFTALRIDELPAPGQARDRWLEDARNRARRLLEADQTERAVLELRAVLPRVAAAADAELAARLRAAILEELARHDPTHEARAAASRAAAATLASLAEEHRRARRPRAAAWLEDHAAALDPTRAKPRGAGGHDEGDAASGQPARPESPLLAWFRDGKPLWGVPWTVTDLEATSPRVAPRRSALWASARNLPAHAKVKLSVRAGHGTGVGLAFALKSRHDFFLLSVRRESGAALVRLLRYRRGKWSTYSMQRPELDAKADWLPLELTLGDGRIEARAAGSEPLVARVEDDLSGKLGLFVEADERAASGRFRGLEVR